MKKLLVLSLFVMFMSVNAQAIEYYDDGQEHDISTSISDSIAIYNGDVHMGPPTTVNVLSGGDVSDVDIYDQSIFNVFSGGQTGFLRAHHESEFHLFGGYVDMIETNHHSQGTVSGGEVFQIDARGDSYTSVSGGTVDNLAVTENSTGVISGGMINRVLGLGNGTIDMSDGSVWEMNLHETSSANMTGGEVQSLTLNQNSQLVMTDVIMDEVGYVQAYDSSRVTMTGGEGFIDAMADSVVKISNATVDVAIQENAQVTVSDSQINYLPPELRMNSSLSLTNTDIMMNNNITLFDTSHLTASTGTGLGTVSLYNNSTFTLSGGFLVSVGAGGGLVEITEGYIISLGALDYCTVDIKGGLIETLSAIEASQVNITGGDISSIFADSSSLIVINGFDFNYGYGYITDTFGTLTGTLLSGEMINTSFERYGDAQILLVPEPATLLVFGFGGLALRRHRK